MGNLHSVQTCFERLGQPLMAVQHAQDLEPCDALVLPGVGAFDPAMQKLHASGLVPPCSSGMPTRDPCLASAWVSNCCSSAVTRVMRMVLAC